MQLIIAWNSVFATSAPSQGRPVKQRERGLGLISEPLAKDFYTVYGQQDRTTCGARTKQAEYLGSVGNNIMAGLIPALLTH